LLFIHHKDITARWIDNDIQILSNSYKIKEYAVNITKRLGFFTSLLKQFFYLLFNTRKYKILFIWFADYHSLLSVFFSKLYGKKCVINIGGYDADEILIGEAKSLKSKFRKFCVKYSVKNCTKLFAVSEVIKSYLLTDVPESKCEVIYNCVNTDSFKPEAKPAEKENLIVTVGGGGEFIKEAKRKRLDFFIELGGEFNKRYPDYKAKFYLIGHDEGTNTYNYLKELITSPNIEIKPMTKSIDELVDYYKRASVYMQLSFYEAFGIAQVEAMLYGCIPVSNSGGAIPEVVGDSGFIIKNYDKEIYISIIKEILDKKHEQLRDRAKERALENFTLTARKRKLIEELEKLKKQ
jgi:glycosyltransferase involved in cell wall biosynthesis